MHVKKFVKQVLNIAVLVALVMPAAASSYPSATAQDDGSAVVLADKDQFEALTSPFPSVPALSAVASVQDIVTVPERVFGLGAVNSVAFSPDGEKAVLGSEAGFAVLVEVDTGAFETYYWGHTGGVTSAAFSPDGTMVLTGSDDNTAKLWDASTGQEIRSLSGHAYDVTSVAFSPDGTKALTGSDDETAKLWDTATGEDIRTFSGHIWSVYSVAFSPDGSKVLTGSDTAKLWDAATGEEVHAFDGDTGPVNSVAFSPDGTMVLTGDWDDTAKLWDTATGEEIRTFSGHGAMVNSVAFSPDGTQVLTGSRDDTAKLWDAATGEEIHTFSGHASWINSVAFSPDGTMVLTGSTDDTAKLWNAATGGEICTFGGDTEPVNSVAFSPDGTMVLTGGSWDGTAKLWDAATGEEIRTFSGHESMVNSVVFSPDGTMVLTGSDDETAKLWDSATGEEIRTFSGHTDEVNSVAFSPDGTRVLTGSDDETAKVWDTATGEEIRTFSGHTGDVTSVAFSPDGTQVLTGSRYDTAKLWDAATGEEIRTFNSDTDVAFSPDGTMVLTGIGYGAILWDASTGEEIRAFSGHTDDVTSVAFSLDGTMVLTGSGDDTAKLWNAFTGGEMRSFSGHTDVVNSAAFSPDGTMVLTGSDDGTARLWDSGPPPVVPETITVPERVFGLGIVCSVAFSPDGKSAVLGSSSGFAVMLDLATGDFEKYFFGHGGRSRSSFYSYYGSVTSVAFSPDGTQVLTGSEDETAKLWDAATGEEIRTFSGHTGAAGPGFLATVNSVAFSPDGTMVLTGSSDDTAKLWNAATGEEIRTFSGHTEDVVSVAFSPDGRHVLTGSDSYDQPGTAKLWDATTGEEIRTFGSHTAPVNSVAFSPDGTMVLTGSGMYDQAGTAKLCNTTTGEEIRTFSDTAPVNSVAFSPDGTMVLTGSGSDSRAGTVTLWDAATGEEIRVFSGLHTGHVLSVAFSPDGTEVLAGCMGRVANLWDVGTGNELLTIRSGHSAALSSVAFSPDGTMVLTGSWDETAQLWDAATGMEILTFSGHTDRVRSVAFSPDGTKILTGSDDGTAKLWNAATAVEIRTFSGHADEVLSVAFSPDGSEVLTGSSDQTARLWDTATGEEIRTFSGHTEAVNSAAFSPDGAQVLTGSDDGTARLWDAATGEEIRSFSNTTAPVNSVAFSPDGTQVLTGFPVRLWDAATGDEIRSFAVGGVSLAFSPDGSYVLTGDTAGMAKLWITETGQELRTFAGHGSHAQSVAFSPDGTKVLTGSWDDTARLWSSRLSPVVQRQPQPLALEEAVEDGVQCMVYRDYSLEATAGSHLLIEVTPLSAIEQLWIYGRLGKLPTLSQYDFQALEPTSRGTYELLVSPTQDRTYFFSVFGRDVGSPQGTYQIVARSVDRYLSDVTPRSVGNTGEVTLSLSGLGFVEDMEVELRADGLPAVAADNVTLASPTSLWAHFQLDGTATGVYDVYAVWPDEEEKSLPGSVTLISGTGPRLEAELVAPEVVRRDREYVLWLEYANAGDASMPAPLFVISGTQSAPIRLSSNDPFASEPVQVLGISFDPLTGLLQPGASHEIPIYFQAPDADEVQFELEQMVADDTPIDWDAMEAEVRPDDINDDLWDTIWANFKARVGDTWADYLATLDEQATYLSQYGSMTCDVRELFPTAFNRASGTYLRRALAWNLDAYSPARGLPLALSRMAFDTLDQRFTVGPFGRNWSHNFEYGLTQPDEDTVLINGPGGSRREFIKAQDGSWQASAGDFGTLREVGSGVYQLQEKDSLVRQFDATGHLDYIEEPNGNRVTLSYMEGKLAEVSHSNGQRFTLESNAQGRISRLTDHAGRVTEYVYDASGEHLLSVIAPGGVTTQYAYISGTGGPADHALGTITYPNGTHQYYDYDAQGRVAAQWRDGEAERVEFTYDDFGTILAEDAEDAVTTLRIGLRSQLMAARDPLGNQVGFQADDDFNLTNVTNPEGGQYELTYDDQGNPTQMEDPLGHSTAMGFTTDLSRLDWLRDARDNSTDLAYDSAGNLTAITYPDDSSEAFSYDEDGNLLSVTKRRGDTITYTYNGLGQVTRKDYPDGGWVTYAYDDVGRVTEVTDASGTIALQYDDRGFLTRIEYPSGHWFTFAHNDAGRRTQRVSDDGYTLNYHYDAAGRLERLTDGASTELVGYEYDDAGRLVKESKGNGTYTTYEYDAAGQLVHMVNYAPDDTVQSRFDYTYDANGNRTSMATLAGTTTYEYDATGQLVGVTYPDGQQVTYEYDALGNRINVSDDGTATSYTTNDMNQYARVGDATYTYDADGNLISKTDSNGTTTYEYDAENRLIRVSTPVSGTWEYTYDALGNRVSVEHDGNVTRYVHDPIGLVDAAAEYDGSDTLVARYVHGLGLVSRIGAAGDPAYYAFDATGNTRQVTDESGAVANTYDYTPFGVPLQVDEAIPNPFQYVGRFGVMEDRNGLNFMRARYYHPHLGRFSSADQLRVAGGPNQYNYALNNPKMYVDPNGRWVMMILWRASTTVSAMYGALTEIWEGLQTGSPDPSVIAQKLIIAGIYGSLVAPEPVSAFWGGRKISKGLNLVIPALGAVVPWLRDNPEEWLAKDLLQWWRNPQRGIPLPNRSLPWNLLSPDVTEIVHPVDPNEKVGPAGVGEQRVVTATQTLEYTVYFENVITATAPAQEVVVVDHLDPNLDWTNFRFQEIAFGDKVVPATDRTYQFATQQTLGDYREEVDKQWQVDITGEMNPFTGRAEWTFLTLDPETDELPQDPLAGFLPPNDDTGRGEGHVTFSVRPRPDLLDGSLLTTKATIVFDTEASITTNEVSNTIARCYDFIEPEGVGVEDIMLVANCWRMTSDDPDWDSRYDLDGDGVITVVDIMKVAANWGSTCW